VSDEQTCGVGSAQHGECWLPAGHAGDHEARDTAATWKPISTLVAQMEGWVPRSRVEAAESALEAALDQIEQLVEWKLGSRDASYQRRRGELWAEAKRFLAIHGRRENP
jgi:hypothetical protein